MPGQECRSGERDRVIQKSEYRYYELQAVDKPLSQIEIAELRALSTRATITSTRFPNVYHYGDFKGDPLTVVARYFDAFVYVAN